VISNINTFMKTSNKSSKHQATEPKIIQGSHSVRTEHPDGRIEFVTIWDKLLADVRAAIAMVEDKITKVVAKKSHAKTTEAVVPETPVTVEVVTETVTEVPAAIAPEVKKPRNPRKPRQPKAAPSAEQATVAVVEKPTRKPRAKKSV
jgi:hypothetical protein